MMYASPPRRTSDLRASIELPAMERTKPAPKTYGKPSVKVRIIGLELPNREQEGAIREAQRFLYLQRTARGTLDDDGQLELSDSTPRLTGGMLAFIETARPRAGLAPWRDYAQRPVHGPASTLNPVRPTMTTTEARRAVKECVSKLRSRW